MVNRWVNERAASRRYGRAAGRDDHPISLPEGNQTRRKLAQDQQLAVYFEDRD